MRAARDIKDAQSVEKRDKTEAATCKSDVFLLVSKADKLRRYRPPSQGSTIGKIRRPSLVNGSKIAEEKIQEVIESNSLPANVLKRYEYKSLEETICKLAIKLELSQLVSTNTALVERLLVAVTGGAESEINSTTIEEVDKTFANDGPSLSRLPSFLSVVDRCLHLHRLLCETKGKLTKSELQIEKLLKEANNRVLLPIAKDVFPQTSVSSKTTKKGNGGIKVEETAEKKKTAPNEHGQLRPTPTEEILQGLRSQHKKEVDEFQVKLRDLEKQRKAAVTSIRAMQNTVKAHEKHINELEGQLKVNAAKDSKAESTEKQIKEVTERLTREYESKIANSEKEIIELKTTLKIEKGKYNNIKAELDSVNNQDHQESYEQQIVELNKKLKNEMEQNQLIFDSNTKLSDELKASKERFDNAGLEIENLEQKILDIESNFETTKVELKNTNDDYQKLLETYQETLNERQKDFMYKDEIAQLKKELKEAQDKWVSRENELIEAGVNTLAREKQFEKERNEALKEVDRLKIQLKTAVEVPKRIERLSKESSERYHNMVSEQMKEISKLKQQILVDESTITNLNEEIKILKKQIQDLTDSRGSALVKASGMSRSEFEDTFEAVMREEFDAMRAAYEKRLTTKQHEMEKIKRSCNKEVREAVDMSKQNLIRLEMSLRRKDAEIESLMEKLLEQKDLDKARVPSE